MSPSASQRAIILPFDQTHPRRAKVDREEQTLGQYIPLAYHYNMLQDEDRMEGFKSAIELLVKPGMRVAELGSGTGVLSSFAARCGAMVEAVERIPELVECSRRLIALNGLASSVSISAGDASCWLPTQPVDVVICEMLHVGLLREKQAQVISAFKSNYVRRFGNQLPVFIPEASILMCQPVEQAFDYAGYIAPVPLFQAAKLEQPRTKEISPLEPYQTIQYDQPIPIDLSASLRLKATTAACMNAIRLVTQNILAIDMSAQRAINWPNQCLILPLETSLTCTAGDEIVIHLDYAAGAPLEGIRYQAQPIRQGHYRAA